MAALSFAPKIGTVDSMLILPPKWHDYSAEHVVSSVLHQANAAGRYHLTASMITHACLQQLVESRGWDKRVKPIALRKLRYGFRINHGLFYVMPQVDDGALSMVEKLNRMRLVTTVLAPLWASLVARRCFKAFSEHGYVSVLGVEEYASLRIFVTSMDNRQDRADAMVRLFTLYNSLARRSGLDTLPIQIPRRRRPA
jgi:hypothetical protein